MTDKYLDILREYWGYDDFRGIQREVIESIGAGRDTLGLMPTGGGKSITFQVPALASEGMCVVVSPLIALMKDQVYHLTRQGIRSAAVYSGMSREEIIATLENCIFGGIKILYVSPERLSSDLFQNKFRKMNVSFITVDEAHCISQWGYDFRPTYLQIARIRQLKPDAPILALTATATPKVVKDIQKQLAFKEENVFQMSFERKNVAYVVRKTENKREELVHILSSVGGCSIVYARSRKRTKEIADILKSNGISSTFFHAGLEPSVKDERQNAWQNDEVRVIVATNAFGMGIDKPDVRLVIHYDCPDSLEAYFQEAGRAGRDGNKSYAVLLYNNSDSRKLEKRIADNFPEKQFIIDVYNNLAYFFQVGVGSGKGYTFDFDIDLFSRTYKHFPVVVDAALKILENAGYIHYETDPDAKARVRFLLQRNELYRLDNLSPHEECVITALLRCYGGLFTDFVYIDEGLIAKEADLDKQQVYLNLRALGQKRIIQFIPTKKIPLITYMQHREAEEYLVIPTEAYEERKQQFAHRIRTMKLYATNDEICRSKQLLYYFGETDAGDCGQCDVCIEHKSNEVNTHHLTHAQQLILHVLEDGEYHQITELRSLNLPNRVFDAALDSLVKEEIVHVQGILIWTSR
ncbi:MAG: RecQ family ATP-dependent DNA helicase [Prevotella sp.]|nr:RecQ family ATP-dependent DNA helicase [Prevotella sp.]